MNEGINDGFDVLTGVIAMLLLLSVCGWSLGIIRDGTEVAVEERLTISTTYTEPATEPTLTPYDIILYLVINDAYMPEPNVLTFENGSVSYTLTVNEAFLADRVNQINTAWTGFFQSRMDLSVTSVSLNKEGTAWVITLE